MEKKLKYYINRETKRLLIDENEYTSYLKDKGYEEISKEEYDIKNQEHLEEMKMKYPELFGNKEN